MTTKQTPKQTMNNEHVMKTTLEATSPTDPSSLGHAVQMVALEHALRLARSANIELGFTLALQCAWMQGIRTPEHVHALLALPRPELARQFLVALKQQDSNATQQHPSWKVLIRKAVAQDAEYHSRVVSSQLPYCINLWISSTGQLAFDILGRVDSDDCWKLGADTAKDLKDCYFQHIS